MLKRRIDFTLPLRFVKYGRMSSDQQNPRSPEQQFDEIDLTIKRTGHRWVLVRTYRDDGISGRLLRKRAGFQAMLRDIRAGLVKADAILVDTWERIGRADELQSIRHELWTKHGVLILTANTQFADPTTESGKVVGMFEQVRATASNDIKAHEVFRGKRDVVLKKRWPGGPPPFGKKLKKCIEIVAGKEVVYSVLERDLEAEPVVIKILDLAKDFGFGQSRIAQSINADPDVSDKFKPMNEHTIGYILDNPIYVGELRWAKYSSGVVDDTRILQKNPESEVIRIPGFCEPIYPREDWDAIQDVRNERRKRLKEAAAVRASAVGGDVKQLAATAPGMVLAYLLTGLIFCAQCNSRMAPCSSKGASRTGKRLSYYRCPLKISGGCSNGRYIREDKLRSAVISRLRSRLFPPPTTDIGDDLVPSWLKELIAEIGQELKSRSANEPDPRPGLLQQREQLEDQLGGWLQSLSKRDLPASLRSNLEVQYSSAADEAAQLQQRLDQLQSAGTRAEYVLDAATAIERLRRLDQVLGSGNVTAGNLELSLHIDRIEIHADGRITMLTSRLGVFEGATELLARPVSQAVRADTPSSGHRVKSRRRAKLRVDESLYEVPPGELEKAQAADVGRFAGLDAMWFWDDPIEITGLSYWSAENADRVAAQRAEDPERWTLLSLAAHFSVSVPTVRKALRLAAKKDEDPTQGEPPSKGDQVTADVAKSLVANGAAASFNAT
jgi:DNA invertase Pin-like site-specific DNA recombinase